LPEIVNVLTVDVEEYFHGIDFDTVLGAEGAARLPSRVVAQTEQHVGCVEQDHRAAHLKKWTGLDHSIQ